MQLSKFLAVWTMHLFSIVAFLSLHPVTQESKQNKFRKMFSCCSNCCQFSEAAIIIPFKVQLTMAGRKVWLQQMFFNERIQDQQWPHQNCKMTNFVVQHFWQNLKSELGNIHCSHQTWTVHVHNQILLCHLKIMTKIVKACSTNPRMSVFVENWWSCFSRVNLLTVFLFLQQETELFWSGGPWFGVGLAVQVSPVSLVSRSTTMQQCATWLGISLSSSATETCQSMQTHVRCWGCTTITQVSSTHFGAIYFPQISINAVAAAQNHFACLPT